MDEITPELVARMASRIFNEKPQAGSAPAFGIAPPEPPSMPMAPEAAAPHMGSLPMSPIGMPHAAPLASASTMSNVGHGASAPASAPHGDSAPSMAPLPGYSHQPVLAHPFAGTSQAFAPSLPE